ncbi:SusC/RagA family TonB-linked outer membrane protein [Joostella sp.]|uniref:SusC/RagA family TonB-linked outer membrane protein n=1 Tax=Joostella sp. TaxID=2231138 RepID=UPI003A8EAF50
MRSKFTWMLTLFMVLVLQFSYGQEKTITGIITDQDGLPLPGANVTVKGTSTGTQTDFDGNYSISTTVGKVLVFSYVGQQTEERTVGAASTINITLKQDSQALEEVIVVGYSTSTKESFTGTATTIDTESIDKKSVSNISQALAGEAAGVRVINTTGQPGESATIRIRGFGSVNGNRDPLYIVDGAPFVGNISAINPADIKSTTILKDASATAIYGSRGANGVIVITTKNGRGEDSYIEVETKTGQNMSLIPRSSTISSPEEYIGLSWEGLYNRGNLLGEDPVAYANENLFSRSGINSKYNMWNVADGGELIDPTTGQVREGVTRKYNPENWEDYAFQPASRLEANLKIGGSNEQTSYFTSFGYLKDQGYTINSDYERITTRLNVAHKVRDWLDGSVNVGYTISDANNNGQTEDSGSVFWFVDNMPSIYPLFLRDTNGDIVEDPIYGGPQYDYGDGRGFGGLTNAIADANYATSKTKRHEINTNAALNIHFSDHLTLENRVGIQYYNQSYDNVDNPFYGPSASNGGSIYKTKTELFSYNILNLLRYKNDWGDHSFEALVAHEANSWERKYLSAYKFNIVIPDGDELNNAVGTNPPSSYTRDFTLESYFGQINYDFDNKYFISGTVRRDGSSRFVKDKWGTFGSLGAAWAVTNEEFMQDQNVFSNLKLKASYGLIGEQGGVGYYPGYDLYNVSNLNGDVSLAFDTKGNPDLTWETSKMFQTGVEMGLGKYLDISVDYYIKNTDNLIFDRKIGPSIGYSSIKVNDGELKNSGIEFNIQSHIVQTKDFYLDFGINGEVLNNELTTMPIDPSTGEEKILNIDGYFGQAEGHSIYDFYMREWAGVDSADGAAMWNQYFYDANGDGQLQSGEESINSMQDYLAQYPERADAIGKTQTKVYQEATQKFVGKSAIPDVRGAFRLATGYKGFSLSAQFLYGLGGHSYDFVYSRLMGNDQVGGNNWHTDILDRWQQPGDVTDVPRLSSNATGDSNFASTSTRFLTKADYLSLNNIRFGYQIPKNYIDQIGLADMEFWISGDNLFLLSERDGFNPTTSEAGTSGWYTYAPLSTITFGVRAKF